MDSLTADEVMLLSMCIDPRCTTCRRELDEDSEVLLFMRVFLTKKPVLGAKIRRGKFRVRGPVTPTSVLQFCEQCSTLIIDKLFPPFPKDSK